MNCAKDKDKHVDATTGYLVWKRGMSISEIASVTGLEYANVRLILWRALQKMRVRNKRLAEYL